jgi:hypothetical protein
MHAVASERVPDVIDFRVILAARAQARNAGP